MLPTPPRLAAHPIMRLERRIASPFSAIGRVDTRAGALVTSAILAVIGVTASLVAVNHLGELFGMSSVGRGLLFGVAIAWIMAGDAVEPLGFRLRRLSASLAGEVDTHRPVAAAWLSAVRAGLGAAALLATAGLAATSAPAAGTAGLFAVALLASQAESVARRRAWALGDAGDRPSPRRSLGRDDELVEAVTGGSRHDVDPAGRRA